MFSTIINLVVAVVISISNMPELVGFKFLTRIFFPIGGISGGFVIYLWRQGVKFRKIRETLGGYLGEGEEIKNECHNESIPAPEEKAAAWAEKVAKYLEINLGKDYRNAFYNSDGLNAGFTTISSRDHSRIQVFMRCRLARIQQFLAELRVKS